MVCKCFNIFSNICMPKLNYKVGEVGKYYVK